MLEKFRHVNFVLFVWQLFKGIYFLNSFKKTFKKCLQEKSLLPFASTGQPGSLEF